MDKIVVVYTMEGCPFCEDMKNQLNEDEIPFFVMDIHENETEYNLFKEITENEFVPAFMIIETDTMTTKLFAPDRDYQEISEGVNIIKKELNLL